MNRKDFMRITSFPGIGYGLLFYEIEALMKFIKSTRKKFKAKRFAWGAASSAYQTEGAVNEDGKTPSIWDKFSHLKNKVKNNENGDVATDFYHRYTEDIKLLEKMNMNSFRFSLAWTRIIPEGTGKVNPKGVDFYHRVIDQCLKQGIVPWVTLYHWDLPRILQDKGG